jgi:hypothetical protein
MPFDLIRRRQSIALPMPEFSSPLWSFLRNTETTPRLLVFMNAIQIVALLIGRANVVPAVILALLLVGCAVIGCWQYRRNRRSIKRIFLLLQLNGWPLAITLGEMMWTASYLTGMNALYREHLIAFGSFFLVVLFLFTCYYIWYWRDGREMYGAIGLHRTQGSISATELHRALTYNGRSMRVLSVLPMIVGVAVPILMLAHFLIGPRGYGFFLFVLTTLVVVPYVFAILIARISLQHRYLGDDDLTVVG